MITLAVLAAGMGSRFGGLKQMVGFGPGGQTILEYSVHDAKAAGFDVVVFLIRREMESDFRDLIFPRLPEGLNYSFAFQELDDLPHGFTGSQREKPWGTGHAVWAMRQEIAGPFMVINADDFYGRDAFEIIAAFLHRPSEDYAMAGYPLRATLSHHGSVARGVCEVSSDGLLKKIEERTQLGFDQQGRCVDELRGQVLADETVVSMNCWGFQTTVFEGLQKGLTAFLEQSAEDSKAEFYLPASIEQMIRNQGQSVRVLPVTGEWLGVTYQQDTDSVRKRLEEMKEAYVF